ncbi:MAG TPA: alpha/beta hydrolase [Polyangia bacterium]|nr:alpha/beta hydrolase [Polyangia bacterium]
MGFLRHVSLIVWTIVAATARRLLQGPRLAGWTIGFELAVAVTRVVAADSGKGPPTVLRRRFVGVRMNRKIRAQIVQSSALVAGCPAETFTPARWTEADPTVLYFHGGGYVVGSPRTHRDLLARLAVAAGARVVAPDYRKAPEHPFPAAVDDGEASYRALLAADKAAGRLFLAGDSAGGGLALAVALRARDAGLPTPCALLLLSPWTSLECDGESIHRNAAFDYLTAPILKRSAHHYLQGADARHPHASPIHADLRGLPPLFIQTGGAELLLSDNQALAQRAASAGVPVVHHVEDHMVHVFPVFCGMLPGPGPAAFARMGDFVRRCGADAARPADLPSLRTAT